MPNGNVSFIEMDDTAQKLLSMLKSNPSVARMLVAEPDGFELIEELFRLLTQGTSRDKLRQVLDGLESPNLQALFRHQSRATKERFGSSQGQPEQFA